MVYEITNRREYTNVPNKYEYPNVMETANRAMGDEPRVKRDDLLYPELSYQIVGAFFDVYNELGDGLLEKIYQRAIAKVFHERGMSFQEQVPCDIQFKGETIGKQFLDFLVEDKIILELKQGDRFRRQNLEQVIAYLKATGKKLAVLANFTRDGVAFRRLVNL